jgi:hypothetical protein
VLCVSQPADQRCPWCAATLVKRNAALTVCPLLPCAVCCCLQTIRYPWYAATLINDCPAALTWLRYTAFIVLYPVGVVAEMILLYVSVRPAIMAWSLIAPTGVAMVHSWVGGLLEDGWLHSQRVPLSGWVGGWVGGWVL